MARDPAPSILAEIETKGRSAPRVRLQEVPGEATPALAEVELRPGSRFEVLGQIAKGGVGRVVKGRDVDLGRDVALKVLLEKHLGNTDLVRRFMEEAQIGGQLQHPGIVPVYDLGLLPDHRPYFAMKLVKGKTLAALLAERDVPGSGHRRLLSIFDRVCRTMAYAHSRGVIHRDLKPSNVMVGAFGEVQLLDWGFAKVLEQGGIADERKQKREQADITRIATLRSEGVGSESIPGSIMGTPAYMPPEQALGHIEDMDERSDVFSLGAILTEILTGEPPYGGEGRDCILMAIRGDVNAALARIDACEADPELTDLARRCLSPLRKDRPRDAGELAEAVSGYLTEVDARAHRSRIAAEEAKAKAEEERAEADRAREKAEAARLEAEHLKRRRRQTTALAASIVLALLIAGGAYSWIAGDRHAERQEAAQAVNEALKEAAHARGEGDLAKALALATRARDIAEAREADEETRARATALLGEVNRAKGAADEEAARAARADDLVRGLGAIRARRSFDNPGIDEAYAELLREHGVEPGKQTPEETAVRIRATGRAQEIAAALDDWAWLRRKKPALGDRDWRALVEVARLADPDPWRNRLRDVLADPDPAVVKELAAEAVEKDLSPRTMDLVGMTLQEAAGPGEAVGSFRVARRRHPEDPWLNYHFARVFAKLDPPNWREAIRYATAAVALQPENAMFRLGLGHCHWGTGECEEAVAVYRSLVDRAVENPWHYVHLAQALRDFELFDEAVAAARKAVELLPGEAAAWAMLGTALDARGDFEEALSATAEALRRNGEDPYALIYRGHSLQKLGRLEEALPLTQKAVALQPNEWRARTVHAEVLLDLGRSAEALAHIEKAIELSGGSENLFIVQGNVLGELREWELATASYRRAVEMAPESALAHTNLAVALQRLGKLDEALLEAREAVRLADSDLRGRTHSNLAAVLLQAGEGDAAREAAEHAVELDGSCDAAHSVLGFIRMGRGERAEARRSYETAIRLNPRNVQALNNLGHLLRMEERFEDAIPFLERALELRPNHVSGHFNLGSCLSALSRPEEAIPHLERVVELDPKHFWGHLSLGWALGQVGRHREAVETCRMAVRLRRDSAEARVRLAAAHLGAGEHEEAIEEFRAGHRLAPEDPQYMNYLAWNLASVEKEDLRDLDEAKGLAERALALAPENPLFLGTLGGIHLFRREPRRARELLEKSVRLHTDARAEACDRLLLAQALWLLGEEDLALGAYRQAAAWLDAHEGSAAEAGWIRTEAEKLLGIEPDK